MKCKQERRLLERRRHRQGLRHRDRRDHLATSLQVFARFPTLATTVRSSHLHSSKQGEQSVTHQRHRSRTWPNLSEAEDRPTTISRADRRTSSSARTRCIDQLLIGIFARGHCILEGVPGLAKTLMVSTLAECLSLEFNRIQFTPDLMPSDITGTEVLHEDRATGARQLRFVPRPDLRQPRAGRRDQPHAAQDAGRAAGSHAGAAGHGRRPPASRCPTRSSCWPRRTRSSRKAPIRCPRRSSTASCSRSSSAIRRRDEERQIYRRHHRHRHAGRDDGARRRGDSRAAGAGAPRAGLRPLHRLRDGPGPRRRAPASPASPEYVDNWISWGAGPRAGQSLILAAKARAALDGRTCVTIDDIRAVAQPVLRHRLVTTYTAQADGQTPDTIVDALVRRHPRPSGADAVDGQVAQVFRS